MDVRKFIPVSYRTSALWGRCPKRKKTKLSQKRKMVSGPRAKPDSKLEMANLRLI